MKIIHKQTYAKRVIIGLFGVFSLFVMNSCVGKSSVSWVGEVMPGEYFGEYDFTLDRHTAHVKLYLLIFENGDFDLKETWKGGGCYEGTRAYNGSISLQEEIYNGEKKSWYKILGYNSELEIVADYSLSTNLELRRGAHDTYQSFSHAKKYCVLHK